MNIAEVDRILGKIDSGVQKKVYYVEYINRRKKLKDIMRNKMENLKNLSKNHEYITGKHNFCADSIEIIFNRQVIIDQMNILIVITILVGWLFENLYYFLSIFCLEIFISSLCF
jgi:hypothetical protein